jgi:DNA-binding winged helix-turn-helix (wHTH) protein
MRASPRQIAAGKANGRPTMMWNTNAKPALYRDDPLPQVENQLTPSTVDATLEFGRFRMLLRRRKLLADGVLVELGTRAFDLLLALAEADGSLITKGELMTRVWPGVTVSEENLKVQISALRTALGGDRDFIRTEFGRGYRFTALVRWIVARDACQHPTRWPSTRGSGFGSISRRPAHRRRVRNRSGRRFNQAHG